MKALSNDECSVCGSDQIVTIPDSGEIVCEHCGAVISDKIEEKGPEWRSFATATAGREENDSNRTGMPFTLSLLVHSPNIVPLSHQSYAGPHNPGSDCRNDSL